MPAITVSAVDTATDKLTGVAHGLLTGDRLRVRNVGGALPTGLAGVTDYFAIKVDVDNIKVATSSANALAGTQIDITGAGSGTTTIEYGLPYCIPTALAAVGTQIKSANDNSAWAALVALYDLLTGQAQSVWSSVTLAIDEVLNGAVTWAGVSTPAAFVAQQDNYAIAPTGVSSVRLVASNVAPANRITGITNGTAGRMLVLHNVGAANAIVLMHNVTSTAANRFQLASATDLTIPVDGSATLQYDAVTARWRVIGKSF